MTNQEMMNNRRILVVDDNHAIHDDFNKVFHSDIREANLDQARAALFGSPQPLQESERFVLDCVDQGQRALTMVQSALKEGRGLIQPVSQIANDIVPILHNFRILRSCSLSRIITVSSSADALHRTLEIQGFSAVST